MSEVVGFVGLSHSPFINFLPPETDQSPGAAFLAAVGLMRRSIAEKDPDTILVIGPDHFHANFYDVMPPFLIGVGAAEGFGDYESRSGRIELDTELAWSVFEDVTAAGFDLAFSLDLMVDHGVMQVLDLLGSDSGIPVVPLLVNSSGPPLPPLWRCLALGQALGKALRAGPDGRRVLVVASGGLSHWIPSTDPRDDSMTAERRDGLIRGRADRRAFAKAREPLVRAMGGTKTARLNESFDTWFLDQVRGGRLDRVVELGSDGVGEQGGNGAQEIRSWLIGLAATEMPITWTTYEPVSEWLTGMGAATTLEVE